MLAMAGSQSVNFPPSCEARSAPKWQVFFSRQLNERKLRPQWVPYHLQFKPQGFLSVLPIFNSKIVYQKSAKWQRVLKPVSFGPRQSKENIANRINRTSKQFDCQDIRNLAWWQPTFDKKRERVTMEFCALIALDTLDFFGARRNFTTMAQREQPKAQAKPAP